MFGRCPAVPLLKHWYSGTPEKCSIKTFQFFFSVCEQSISIYPFPRGAVADAVKSAVREDCFRNKAMPAKHIMEGMEKIIHGLHLLSQHIQ